MVGPFFICIIQILFGTLYRIIGLRTPLKKLVMIKEQRNIKIFGVVASLVPVLASKKLATLIKFRVAFFIYISSIHPQTTEFDLIETKTTWGGKQTSLSMLKIPLFHHYKSVCNAFPATYDLTQIWDNAAKFNSRSIINTQNCVKGLIELI